MKNECSIVKDVMPLCIDDIASNDTKEFVKQHIENCTKCEKEWNFLNHCNNSTEKIVPDIIPLKNVKRKIFLRVVKAVLLAVIIVFATFTATNYHLNKVHCVPFSTDLIKLSVENNRVTFNIKGGQHRGLSFIVYNPDFKAGAEPSENYNKELVYLIKLEYTYADNIFGGQTSKDDKQYIDIKEGQIVTIYYSNPDDNQNILLYHNTDKIGENYEFSSGSRDSLFMLNTVIVSAATTIVFLILIITFQKHKRIRSVLQYLLMLPVSYLIAYAMLIGFKIPNINGTYGLFYNIIILTILIYFIEVLIRRIILVHHLKFFMRIKNKFINK